MLFKVYVTLEFVFKFVREMELRHLSLPLRFPLLRKRQKDKEIMKMQYLFHSVHGDDKIPPDL